MRHSHPGSNKPPSRPAPNSELRNLLDEYAASTVAVPSTSGHLFVSLPSGDHSHSCIPIHDPFLFDWLRFSYLRDFQQFPCDANLYTVRSALATRARFYSAAPPGPSATVSLPSASSLSPTPSPSTSPTAPVKPSKSPPRAG